MSETDAEIIAEAQIIAEDYAQIIAEFDPFPIMPQAQLIGEAVEAECRLAREYEVDYYYNFRNYHASDYEGYHEMYGSYFAD